jgi:hypothetical protein
MSLPPPDNQSSIENLTRLLNGVDSPETLEQWIILFGNRDDSDITFQEYFKFEKFMSNYKKGYGDLDPDIKEVVDNIWKNISALSVTIKLGFKVEERPEFYKIFGDMKNALSLLASLLEKDQKKRNKKLQASGS